MTKLIRKLRAAGSNLGPLVGCKTLRVLAYHDIRDQECFAQQINHLIKHYSPLSFSQLSAALAENQSLPANAIVITFDDGHRSVYELGLPILRSRQVPAIVFVVAGLINSTEPFWWDDAKRFAQHDSNGFDLPSPDSFVQHLKMLPDEDRVTTLRELRKTRASAAVKHLTSSELRELELHGISVGNHTFSHPCLNRCDHDKVQAEIENAHNLLTDFLGHRPMSFAYPNGDFDTRAAKILHRLGYRTAFLFDHQIVTWPVADPFRISRVRVDSAWNLRRFRASITGLHPFLHRMMGRR